MIGIVLSLLAAIAYAASVTLMRKRLYESTVLTVALVVTSISSIILWPLALIFTNMRAVNLGGVLFFAIAGVLAPGITRLLYLKGMDTLGASVNACVYASYPMYSAILAVLLLQETLSMANWIGITCVIFGVVSIEGILAKNSAGKGRNWKYLVFPIVAGLTMTAAQLIRKQGLSIYNEAILGAAIGCTFSSISYLLFLIASGAAHSCSYLKEDFRSTWKSGVGLSLGALLLFYALDYERVSVVTPIMQAEALFVILFGHLYFKRLEQISSKVVIIAFFILLGVILAGIR